MLNYNVFTVRYDNSDAAILDNVTMRDILSAAVAGIPVFVSSVSAEYGDIESLENGTYDGTSFVVMFGKSAEGYAFTTNAEMVFTAADLDTVPVLST